MEDSNFVFSRGVPKVIDIFRKLYKVRIIGNLLRRVLRSDDFCEEYAFQISKGMWELFSYLFFGKGFVNL